MRPNAANRAPAWVAASSSGKVRSIGINDDTITPPHGMSISADSSPAQNKSQKPRSVASGRSKTRRPWQATLNWVPIVASDGSDSVSTTQSRLKSPIVSRSAVSREGRETDESGDAIHSVPVMDSRFGRLNCPQ